ncbi:MAG: MopE-related protein [Sandaracinus sp.]
MRSFVRVSLASLAALTGGILVASCQVEPYCFDCVDDTIDAGGSMDGGDSGRADSGDANTARDGAGDTNPPDAWIPPDGCTVGAPELCNHFDDDCDTLIDEGVVTDTDVNNCGSCGHRCLYAHAFGECAGGNCSMGTCSIGYYDQNGDPTDGCEYHCVATGDETCDRRDNDCDGTTDEGFMLDSDPMNCGICGRVCNLAHTTASSCAAGACTIGGCLAGFVDRDGVPQNGCEYACTPTGTETCNRVDDDCDGTIDEGDPGSGGNCGSSQGICTPGTLHCVGGALVCQGGVSPGVESCNNLDDDCDGTIDDGNPGGGPACGSAVGACLPGRLVCTGGALVCQGGRSSSPERCDGLDNDCDGTVDNGDPDSGAACGTETGECAAGTQHCVGGSLACQGAVGPALETCNMRDDDCNGVVDNGFDLMNDPRNCGVCGRVCSFAHGVAACVMGSCQLVACAGGYFNNDGNLMNGCEYMCTRTSATEACNGVDDNCNGTVDEGVTPPANFCRQAGVCMGSTATCTGTGGFVCNYAANATSRGLVYEPIEMRCDTKDNDCDGFVDEPFPLLNAVCTNGQAGICNLPGHQVCDADGMGIHCDAPSGMSMSRAESCNGLDDNCDGMVDNGTSSRGTWTRVRPVGAPTNGTGDYWIMAYEASRPDGTATSQGSLGTGAVCSEPSRLPWTDITAVDAAAACARVGASLCTETQWQRACESSAGTACVWSETTTCGTYSATACNGLDYDTDGSMSGNQDALVSTSALSATCGVPWSFMVGTTSVSGTVYNMSGNAQEWTAPRSAGVNPVRGGSYNDISSGMTCGARFEAGGNSIHLPNLGFRCCRTTDPALP